MQSNNLNDVEHKTQYIQTAGMVAPPTAMQKESVKWGTILVGQNADPVQLQHLQFHIIESNFKMSFETAK